MLRKKYYSFNLPHRPTVYVGASSIVEAKELVGKLFGYSRYCRIYTESEIRIVYPYAIVIDKKKYLWND